MFFAGLSQKGLIPRIVVTVLALAAVSALLHLIPTPGFDGAIFAYSNFSASEMSDLAFLKVGGIGLAPFIAGFLLIEAAATVIPPKYKPKRRNDRTNSSTSTTDSLLPPSSSKSFEAAVSESLRPTGR